MIKEYSFNDVLLAEKGKLASRIQMIDALLGDMQLPIKQDTKTPPKIEIPEGYDNNLTWEGKTLFIINKSGSVYSSEIVDEISKYEESQDKKGIAKSISQVLVKLKKANKIITPVVTGRKFKYEINRLIE